MIWTSDHFLILFNRIKVSRVKCVTSIKTQNTTKRIILNIINTVFVFYITKSHTALLFHLIICPDISGHEIYNNQQLVKRRRIIQL